MAHPVAASPPAPHVLPKHLTLEYLGFRNAGDRREYLLCARSGAESREYTVWIAHAAFVAGQALLQDGPDICYQKLWRALAESELTGAKCVEVTEGELKDYRAAHAPPTRRSQAPKQGPPSPNVWLSAARPAPRERG